MVCVLANLKKYVNKRAAVHYFMNLTLLLRNRLHKKGPIKLMGIAQLNIIFKDGDVKQKTLISFPQIKHPP